MKIERINENSIRCTLTGFDLSVRNLNLRDMAYGTEKARKLFQEMMAKASNEVGFEAENVPIMIEAIPLSADSIQLIISKVENPEELDTRFSKFTPSPQGAESWIQKLVPELLEGADDILKQMKERGAQGASQVQPAAGQPQAPQQSPYQSAILSDFADELYQRAFLFDDLDKVILTAHSVGTSFTGFNRLYKRSDGKYVLVIHNDGSQKDEFSKVCNMLSEYASKLKISPSSEAYFDEHYELIIKDDALKKLSLI